MEFTRFLWHDEVWVYGLHTDRQKHLQVQTYDIVSKINFVQVEPAGQAGGGSFKPEKAISQRKNLPIVTSGEMSCDVVTMKW